MDKFTKWKLERLESCQVDIEGSEYPCYSYPEGIDILIAGTEANPVYITEDGEEFDWLIVAEAYSFALLNN